VKTLVAAAVGCAVTGLLYLSLDSGRFSPPAERLVSAPLLGLAAIFGAASWAARAGGLPRRAPFFAGLAAGTGAYALFRLIAL
jgi:hypothetical protein